MSKITSEQIKNDFEEIVGWKYVTPGTNDINGIDCSGAWVRCYKKHGYSILHGSNSIFRKECSSTGKINSKSDLKVGMMVFKNRFDGKEPEKYQGDGLGNFYHIGAVTSINPLVITHATSPNAKQDTKFNSSMNGWTHWGIGNKVELTEVTETDATEGGNEAVAEAGELQNKNCRVVTDDKTSVNMRKEGNKKGALVVRVPYNEIVLVTSDNGDDYVGTRWEDAIGVYKNVGKIYAGYMAREFLSVYDENSDDNDLSEDSSNVDVIVIDEKEDLEKRIYNATVATNASVEYAETLKKCAYDLFPEFADK